MIIKKTARTAKIAMLILAKVGLETKCVKWYKKDTICLNW